MSEAEKTLKACHADVALVAGAISLRLSGVSRSLPKWQIQHWIERLEDAATMLRNLKERKR